VTGGAGVDPSAAVSEKLLDYVQGVRDLPEGRNHAVRNRIQT
jgi:hypothetical protein